MIRIFKKVGLLSVLMLLFASCQKEVVVNPYLEVNSSNINGAWTLTSVDGKALEEGTYFYIRFELSGNKFTIYENLTSVPEAYNKDEGTFSFYVDREKGTYIRGIDSIGDQEWSDMYYIKNLTANEMTWIGYNNSSFVQVFTRVNSIPQEIKQ